MEQGFGVVSDVFLAKHGARAVSIAFLDLVFEQLQRRSLQTFHTRLHIHPLQASIDARQIRADFSFPRFVVGIFQRCYQ